MLSTISIDIINSLTISELDVLKYVDVNAKAVINMSIHDLAKNVFVSSATIMRLCKKIGFSGFTEMKYCLKEEITKKDHVRENMTFENVINTNLAAINETAKCIESKKVEKVVSKMLSSSKIHFFGKGLTLTILECVSKQLLTYNRENYIYHDTHIAYLCAEKMTSSDIVFIGSVSGNTHQVVRMAQLAKSRGAFVVTISKNNSNELSKIGDINFSFSSKYDNSNVFDIASRLPMLFILNIITSLYAEKFE